MAILGDSKAARTKAGNSREVVEALIAATPTGHLLTQASKAFKAAKS